MLGLFGRRIIADQSLQLGDARRITPIRRSHFERCDITITCPACGIIINDVIFHDCTIKTRRTFVDYQFFHAGFDSCRFVGEFPGCEFGYRRSVASGGMRGYIRNCDFSEAQLDFVGFNGTDVSGLRLPAWPHFLIKSPAAFAEVVELADDLEWTSQSEIIWPAERTGLLRIYRTGGKEGFKLPTDEARTVLERYPSLIFLADN